MASHPSNDNPWQDETSQQPSRNQYQTHGAANPNPYSTYQDQTQSQNPYAQEGPYQAPNHPPPHQQPLSSHPPDQQPRYYQDSSYTSSYASEPQPQQHQQFNPNPSFPSTTPQQSYAEETPPSLPPRRTDTDLAMPQGQDRSHQIEVMQSYEAAGRKDEDDTNVEVLQREFPRLDGALIAAIYGDSKSLSATREMLGELDVEG